MNVMISYSEFRRRRSFTILEILLAVTIMSLVSIALFSVFTAGTRAYRATHRDAALIQRASYIFETFERDVQNLFYRDEDTYNVNAREMLTKYQEAIAQYEQTGDRNIMKPYMTQDQLAQMNEEDFVDNPSYVGNPFEKAKLIDLQFVGEDSGETDSITFAIRMPYQLGGDYTTWGLARVNYSVENGYLIRSTESVDVNPRSMEGVILPKDDPVKYSIVAEGVDEFELRYSFWWDYQWFEVDNWASSDRRYRNSSYLMGEYDWDEETPIYLRTGSEENQQYINQLQSLPYDRVPTYVRLSILLSDPERPGRKLEISRIFRIPNSQETWAINQQIEEEDREMELDVRLSEYHAVSPGALRKR